MNLNEMQQMAQQTREAYRRLELAQWGCEWTIQDLFCGMVGDVGELAQLLGAFEKVRPGPDDLQAALAHELSDILWSVLVIANELELDLEGSFSELHETLLERISAKLEKIESPATHNETT